MEFNEEHPQASYEQMRTESTANLMKEAHETSLAVTHLWDLFTQRLSINLADDVAMREHWAALKKSQDQRDREDYQQINLQHKKCRSYFEYACYLHARGLLDQVYVDALLLQRARNFLKIADAIDKANFATMYNEAYNNDALCYKHNNRPWVYRYIEQQLGTEKDFQNYSIKPTRLENPVACSRNGCTTYPNVAAKK